MQFSHILLLLSVRQSIAQLQPPVGGVSQAGGFSPVGGTALQPQPPPMGGMPQTGQLAAPQQQPPARVPASAGGFLPQAGQPAAPQQPPARIPASSPPTQQQPLPPAQAPQAPPRPPSPATGQVQSPQIPPPVNPRPQARPSATGTPAELSTTDADATDNTPCPPSFDSCISQNNRLEASICQPFAASNRTMYNVCHCYAYVSRSLCFRQCTGNTQATSDLANIRALISQTCTPLGLNPASLPQPPPWRTATSSRAGPTGSPASTWRSPSALTDPHAPAGSNPGTSGSPAGNSNANPGINSSPAGNSNGNPGTNSSPTGNSNGNESPGNIQPPSRLTPTPKSRASTTTNGDLRGGLDENSSMVNFSRVTLAITTCGTFIIGLLTLFVI